MRRTVGTTLIAAAVVAAAAGPSFAGKPTKPTTPPPVNYTVVIDPVVDAEAGDCYAVLRAEFSQAPETVPTDWVGAFSRKRIAKPSYAFHLGVEADGGSGTTGYLLEDQKTLYYNIAPVYDGGVVGPAVSGSYTCVV